MTYTRVIGTARIETGPDVESRPCSRCGLVRALSGKPAGMCRACSVLDDPPRTDAEDDWRARGTCAGSDDPELWFPVGQSGPARAQEAEAKAICADCPVRQDCATWALDVGEDHGVWGGLSEDERRALRRRAHRKPSKSARLPVAMRALGALQAGQLYTGSEIGEAVGTTPAGSGGAVGSLLSARIIERHGEKPSGQSGKQRIVPAYRLVGSGKSAMATSSTARDWYAERMLEKNR